MGCAPGWLPADALVGQEVAVERQEADEATAQAWQAQLRRLAAVNSGWQPRYTQMAETAPPPSAHAAQLVAEARAGAAAGGPLSMLLPLVRALEWGVASAPGPGEDADFSLFPPQEARYTAHRSDVLYLALGLAQLAQRVTGVPW